MRACRIVIPLTLGLTGLRGAQWGPGGLVGPRGSWWGLAGPGGAWRGAVKIPGRRHIHAGELRCSAS